MSSAGKLTVISCSPLTSVAGISGVPLSFLHDESNMHDGKMRHVAYPTRHFIASVGLELLVFIVL